MSYTSQNFRLFLLKFCLNPSLERVTTKIVVTCSKHSLFARIIGVRVGKLRCERSEIAVGSQTRFSVRRLQKLAVVLSRHGEWRSGPQLTIPLCYYKLIEVRRSKLGLGSTLDLFTQ